MTSKECDGFKRIRYSKGIYGAKLSQEKHPFGWTLKPKKFARQSEAGWVIREESGWVLHSPNHRTVIKLELDAKRITFIHRRHVLTLGW